MSAGHRPQCSPDQGAESEYDPATAKPCGEGPSEKADRHMILLLKAGKLRFCPHHQRRTEDFSQVCMSADLGVKAIKQNHQGGEPMRNTFCMGSMISYELLMRSRPEGRSRKNLCSTCPHYRPEGKARYCRFFECKYDGASTVRCKGQCS